MKPRSRSGAHADPKYFFVIIFTAHLDSFLACGRSGLGQPETFWGLCWKGWLLNKTFFFFNWVGRGSLRFCHCAGGQWDGTCGDPQTTQLLGTLVFHMGLVFRAVCPATGAPHHLSAAYTKEVMSWDAIAYKANVHLGWNTEKGAQGGYRRLFPTLQSHEERPQLCNKYKNYSTVVCDVSASKLSAGERTAQLALSNIQIQFSIKKSFRMIIVQENTSNSF